MKKWFVEPYDFSIKNGVASYTMQRINLPNIASVWVEGAYDWEQLDRLLSSLFRFIKERKTQAVAAEIAETNRHKYYVDKVKSRFENLQKWELYTQLESVFAGTTSYNSLNELYEQYYSLYDKIAPNTPLVDLAVSHGDLCFSNILYGRDRRQMYFIDPRGGSQIEDIYIDPYYDICKISHSVMGGYDFINMHKYELQIEKNIKTKIVPAHPPRTWMRETFQKHVAEAGYDFRFVRLGELSLFLSMVPLHIDNPKNVFAFLLTANNIMQELQETL
jgi:hypothetical protein